MLAAEFNDFGDALRFVLHRHLPVVQRVFFLCDLIEICLDPLCIVSADLLHLFFDLAVFLRLARLEIFQLLHLRRFIGRERILASRRIGKQFVGRDSGSIQCHQ